MLVGKAHSGQMTCPESQNSKHSVSLNAKCDAKSEDDVLCNTAGFLGHPKPSGLNRHDGSK